MILRENLHFSQSSGAKLSIDLAASEEEQESITLDLKAVLTRQVADALNVGWVFASDTTAHGGFKEIPLEKSTRFADLQLKLASEKHELEMLHPALVYAFKVFKLSGGLPGIEFKADIEGNTDIVLEFLRQNRADGFSFILKPRQQDLSFDGGTRVDLAAEPVEGEAAPLEDGLPDRSHENAPRRRGRPAGARNKVQPIAQTEAEKSEWDNHYEAKAEKAEQPEEALVEG